MVEKVISQTAPAQESQPQITRWAVSVADYHRMAEAGILGEDDRVELIDGEVRVMSPIGKPHAAIVNRYVALLVPQVDKIAIVSPQNPFELSAMSEPQPDVLLLRYRDDFYAKETPKPADILLLIEVCDSTLAYDRLEKLPRYALAGIPEVWLTDVNGEAIERYTDPQGDQYATKQTFKRGQTITVKALPNIVLSVDQIFGNS